MKESSEFDHSKDNKRLQELFNIPKDHQYLDAMQPRPKNTKRSLWFRYKKLVSKVTEFLTK